MKIDNVRGVGAGAGAKKGASAAPGFSVAVDAPQRAAATAPTADIAALDAILALQGEDGPMQRRARQVRRGRDALDALDELKTGLLRGRAPAALQRELDGLREAAEVTGDSGLDTILHEIDTRLAVEAAKLETFCNASGSR